MNLIYISNARLPTEKAHGIQIMKMCEAFTRQGVKVELIHPFRVQTNKMKEVRDIWSYYDVEKIFELKMLPSLDLGLLFRILPKSWEKIWFFAQSISYAVIAFLWLLFRKLTRNDDIVYSRDQFSLFLILLFKRFIRAKVFFEAHAFPRSNRKTAIFLFKRLDGLIVITQKLKELYVSEGMPEELMLAAPDGVDLERLNNSFSKIEARQKIDIPLESKVVSYIGHLFPWKGVYTLVESAKYLPQDYLILFVGGMEADIRLLRDYTEKEGINNIKLAGFINPSDIPSYLFSADVLVLPNSANEDISIYYTSPLKMFEYMASKRPIVASDLPSVGEILRHGENAILVEPNNSETLAVGIKKVLENKELASKISKQAFKDVQKYSWDKRARRIMDFMGGGVQ